MTNEEQLLIAIKADTTNLMSGLKAAGTGMDNFASKISGIGKGMTIVGVAITAAFGMAVKTASNFEQSMANTASVAGATAEELQRMSDAAREMGKQSVYSASEAADAMYYLGSAGLEADQIIGALSGTMTLAAATQSDLAYTSEAITATLSQFNFEAEKAGKVANIFAAAISGSQATMEKLKTSMSYVGPVAKSLGMTLEETTGILMNLYNAGYDGSKAGTALRMAFSQLLDPTQKAAAALDHMKISITDSAGQMRPFKDIIDDLGRAGMTAADAMDIFGKRAGPAMLALVSQGEGAIEKMTEKITDTNKAAEMAAIQMDTFKGAVKLLKSAFEEFQIIIANHIMPTITWIIKGITKAINVVSAWMEKNVLLTDIIVKLGAVIGAICVVGGPILMAVSAFGKMKLAMIGVATCAKVTLIPSITAVKGALLSLGTIATGPIGLLILAVGGLYVAWDKNLFGMKDITKEVFDDIKSRFEDLEEGVKRFYKVLNSLGGGGGGAGAFYDPFDEKGSGDASKVTEEAEKALKEAETAADALAKAISEIDNRLYELSHTTMEYAVHQLEQQRQAYIDLGVTFTDAWAWYDAEIAKLNDLTVARETFAEAMKAVEDRMYELTHTQRENEIRLLDEKKAKLIEIAKQAGLSAKEEIEAIKQILAMYQKELDILNKLEGIKAGKRYNIYQDGVNIASVGAEQAQHMLEEGYDVFEISSNTPTQEPGQILSEVPKLGTGTPMVKKSGVAIIDKGEGVLTPEQNKAYQAGGKSYTININNPVVRNDDDISRMREQFEESIKKLIPEFNRSGNYSVPGMA